MNSKSALCGLAISVALLLGMLGGSAQTNKCLFSGSETNIALNPGTYIITAYGASGGGPFGLSGGTGALMSAEFNFSTSTTLALLVGGFGGESSYSGGGGGKGEFYDGGNGIGRRGTTSLSACTAAWIFASVNSYCAPRYVIRFSLRSCSARMPSNSTFANRPFL
jgi:hypothetical protein